MSENSDFHSRANTQNVPDLIIVTVLICIKLILWMSFIKSDSVDLHKVDSMDELYQEFPDADFYYLTTKSKKLYTDIKYKDGDFIVFGPETRGLPEKYVTDKNAVTIPMKEGQRSLNLSNSVAITAYEVIRQNGL